MQWDLLEVKPVYQTNPFIVEEIHLKDKFRDGPKHPYYRLRCPDWVNILPVTSDNRAILIRQSRAGSFSNILETPGGVMEKAEKDPTLTAQRELEEETGFTSIRFLPLAALNPNPAIMTNRLHMFLALNCVPVTKRKHFPDAQEKIDVELVPLADLDTLIRTGQLNSCLAALTICLARKYLTF